MRTVEVTLKLVFEISDDGAEEVLPQLHTRVEELLQGSDYVKNLWKLGTVSDAYVALVEERYIRYMAE